MHAEPLTLHMKACWKLVWGSLGAISGVFPEWVANEQPTACCRPAVDAAGAPVAATITKCVPSSASSATLTGDRGGIVNVRDKGGGCGTGGG